MHLTPREQEKLLVFTAAEVARRRRARGLDQRQRDAAAHAVAAREHLPVRLVLREHGVRAPQPKPVKARGPVSAGRRAHREAPAVARAKQREQPYVSARAARVVEVGVGARKSLPQPAPARMKEPEERQAGVRGVGLEDADAVPFPAIGLAVVPGHHAHVIAAALQGAREERLLHALAGDVVVAELGGEDGEVFQAEEADSHAASLRRRHVSRSGR